MQDTSLLPSKRTSFRDFVIIAILIEIDMNRHGGMYMAEVLDAVCLKRKLNNPKEYALVLDLKPVKLFVPLDRTVKSLQGKRDLMLIKKSMLQTYGVEMGKRITGRSTDPNGQSTYFPWCILLVLTTYTCGSINLQAYIRRPRTDLQLSLRLCHCIQGTYFCPDVIGHSLRTNYSDSLYIVKCLCSSHAVHGY